jgi:hypothetical protein
MGAFVDLEGAVIGYFTLLRRASNSANGRVRWFVRCVCGKELIMHGSRAAFIRKRSCGCKKNLAHGNRRHDYTSPEYQSWRAMRNRCNNSKDKSFPDYGGRGIKICKRWDSFVYFLQDMGKRPEGTTLDREDYNGNYEPGNCRWSDASTQATNKRPRFAIESFSDEVFLKEYNRRFYGRRT